MTDAPTDSAYRVLARKYRPATFSDLVGEAIARIKRDAKYILPIHDPSIVEKYGQGLE